MMRNVNGFILRWSLAGALVLALAMLPGGRAVQADMGHGHSSFSGQSLDGRYITAGIAWDASITGTPSEPNPPSVPFAGAGFLNFDGKGKISSGEQTINYGSPGTGDSFTCDLAGTYTVDSATGRVILSLTVTPGPAVTTAESTASNTAQCGGTGTWVGYLDSPDGARLATIEQTNTSGTPTAPAASTTPILSAHVWTKAANGNGNDN